MLQLRRPTHLISLVRQNPRRFEVVNQELGPQTVRGDFHCVHFINLVQRVLRLGVFIIIREEFLGIIVVGGGGGVDARAVGVEGAEVGGVGGVDGGAGGRFRGHFSKSTR